MNDWVDVLVDLYKNRVDIASSEANLTGEKSRWRRNLERIATDTALNRNEKYTNFVKALLKRKLNPVEHKYIIRALLQNLHVGIHLKDIMSFYSPHGKLLGFRVLLWAMPPNLLQNSTRHLAQLPEP